MPGSAANSSPRVSTFGQERFSSSRWTASSAASRSATRANSSALRPTTLTATRAPASRRNWRSVLQNCSTPGFWRPMALSIPDGVSAIRGVGRPRRGSRLTDLVTTPPMPARSRKAAISRPKPKQPDAARTGVASGTPHRSTASSGST